MAQTTASLRLVKAGAQPSRVLLVEDNDSDAIIAQAAIERVYGSSSEVLRVASLADALARLRSGDMDLVLLDLNLPDSRGIDTLKHARAVTTCPIIIVTASDAPDLDAEALDIGAFEILHKSRLSSDAMVRMLRLAAEQRSAHIAIALTKKELDHTNSRLELALAASRACTWDLDLATGEIVLSASWSQIVGARAGATRTTLSALLEMVHPEEIAHIRSIFADSVKGARSEYSVEHRVRHESGDWRWIVSRGKVLKRDAKGRALRMVGSNLDISDRKRSEEQLRESELRFRSLTELFSDWYWEQDADLRFVATGGRTEARGGITSEEHLGRRSWELPGTVIVNQTWDEHQAMLATRQPFRNLLLRRTDSRGEEYFVDVSGEPRYDANGAFCGYRGVASDVTARIRAEARLAQLAQFDEVTGLPNRSLLGERLDQAIAQARRRGHGAGVLFIDVDHFKLVNDTFGHKFGDELLAQVGKRLKDCVRPDDTIGRLSGDEFAVVIADLSRAEDAAIVAQKIIGWFASPFQLHGQEAFVTVSVGIAVFPADGDDAAALLKCADTAMYRVKESSRNAFCFFAADMNTRAASKLHLYTDLRHAVDRREFLLYYQPKVDLSSGAIIGMEALLRWQHPVRGMVSPMEFIPALEDTGLIVPVGDWVIEEARMQLRSWLNEGLELIPIAVNLSAKQFHRRNLHQLICDLLAAQGISPQMLDLEITESCLMDDPKDAVRQLHALREVGFSISVDDFGTGYSSLGYLTRLPLSALKIDRSFVNAAITEPASAAIVKMVIDMSQSLRFSVIAEGIETEKHVVFLRSHGCDQGQGYLFGKPMPAASIAERMKRRTRSL
jgi:diguanylate cyclase (GGDEF)-like protein/PAS domain S-box-containing protein